MRLVHTRCASLVRGVSLFVVPAALLLWTEFGHADTVVRTFLTTRTEETLVIPHGVHSISFAAVGGAGGNGSGNAGGAPGARVSAVLTVTPGQTLYIRVGGNGSTRLEGGDVGGFNGGGEVLDFGGGGGGGASDVRTVPSGGAGSLDSRLLVAGGGGGSGAGSTAPLPNGGAGGVPDGGNGTNDGTSTAASGMGASDTAGGAAGVGGVGDGRPTSGELANGGTGVSRGGGGGGGLFGGGGGRNNNGNAGSGGGGSSYIVARATNAAYAIAPGVPPSIAASWALPNLTVSNPVLVEGNAGTTLATFTVTLSEPAGDDGVFFDVATADGTATVADGDYLPFAASNVLIAAGEKTATVPVRVNGDTKFELSESFRLMVSNLRGALPTAPAGEARIDNDDTQSPVITSPGNVVTEQNTPTAALPFTVNDPDTAAASLQVTASSSNPAVVAQDGLSLGGEGTARNIAIMPVREASGTSTITLSVSDGSHVVTATFDVTVKSVHAAPTIAPLENVSVASGAFADVVLKLADADSPLETLTLTAVSSNAAMVSADKITLTGTGGERHARIPTTSGSFGSSVITFTVSDGRASTQRAFTLFATEKSDGGASNSDGGANAGENASGGGEGCGCHQASGASSSRAAAMLTALALMLTLRKRRRAPR